MTTLKQIHQDPTLYGHSLTRLPQKLWHFTKGEFSLYENPDPGTLVIEQDYVIIRNVSFRKGNRYIYKTETLFDRPILNSIEFIGRRILGSCATVASLLILAPIGFSAKVLHFGLRQVSAFVTSTALAKKISEIWNNADLYGHFFTSAPLKCYEYATSPLGWHLRPDGTDRRNYIYTFYTIGGVPTHTTREAEYSLVPFELFEFSYKRVVVGSLTLTAAMISPIGLVTKSLHLASRSFFEHGAGTP